MRMAAPMIERALAGETVDQLIWRAIGKGASAVEIVLAANPNLADLGLFLPRDKAVVIPIAATGPAARPMIQLWT